MDHVKERISNSKIVTSGLTRKEEEKEGSSKEVHEKPVPTDAAAFFVLFSVESVQQSTGDQVLRPYHAGGPDKESSTESGQAEPSQLCSQYKRDVKTEAVSDAIVHLKDHDGVQGVRCSNRDVGHNIHQHVLLDIPGSRIKGTLQSAEPSR